MNIAIPSGGASAATAEHAPTLLISEALAARQAQWLGSIRISRPLSFSVVTGAAVAMAAALIAFDCWCEVTRKVTVHGFLLPQGGRINGAAQQAEVISEVFVRKGDEVKAGQSTPAPRQRQQYDLNAVLPAAGPRSEPLAMDAALPPHLDEPALRHGFVTAVAEVRAWLRSWTGSPAHALDDYLRRQSARKNAELDLLRRDENASLSELRRLEVEGQTQHVGAAIDAALRQARHGLADRCPMLPGANGLEQLKGHSEPGQVCSSPAERGQEPAPATEPA